MYYDYLQSIDPFIDIDYANGANQLQFMYLMFYLTIFDKHDEATKLFNGLALCKTGSVSLVLAFLLYLRKYSDVTFKQLYVLEYIMKIVMSNLDHIANSQNLSFVIKSIVKVNRMVDMLISHDYFETLFDYVLNKKHECEIAAVLIHAIRDITNESFAESYQQRITDIAPFGTASRDICRTLADNRDYSELLRCIASGSHNHSLLYSFKPEIDNPSIADVRNLLHIADTTKTNVFQFKWFTDYVWPGYLDEAKMYQFLVSRCQCKPKDLERMMSVNPLTFPRTPKTRNTWVALRRCPYVFYHHFLERLRRDPTSYLTTIAKDVVTIVHNYTVGRNPLLK
jgi:hypothetical protein